MNAISARASPWSRRGPAAERTRLPNAFASWSRFETGLNFLVRHVAPGSWQVDLHQQYFHLLPAGYYFNDIGPSFQGYIQRKLSVDVGLDNRVIDRDHRIHSGSSHDCERINVGEYLRLGGLHQLEEEVTLGGERCWRGGYSWDFRRRRCGRADVGRAAVAVGTGGTAVAVETAGTVAIGGTAG